MKQCKRCGRRGFFLWLNEDGICSQCQYELQQKKISEKEAKNAEELEYATRFYHNFAASYAHSFVDINTCTLDSLKDAINGCKEFCEQFEHFNSVPMVKQVFLKNTQFYSGFVINKEFDLQEIESGNSICLDSLHDKIAKRRELYRRMIEESGDFETILASIPIVQLDLKKSFVPSQLSSDGILPLNESNITKRTALSKVSTFFAVDTETTGLSISTSEIIQLSAIKFVNFQPISAFITYVKPKRGINPRAQEINHITEELVADAPPIEKALPAFDDYISMPFPIVAHNLSFDFNFLCAEGSRIYTDNLSGTRKFYDTLSLGKRSYQSKRNSLDYLCRNYLKIIRSDAHDALSDALAAGLLFKDICEKRIS